jgi:hypothetical protein
MFRNKTVFFMAKTYIVFCFFIGQNKKFRQTAALRVIEKTLPVCLFLRNTREFFKLKGKSSKLT